MGFGCDNLESENYSNFNDDICYVTAMGRTPLVDKDGIANSNAGEIKLYRIPAVAPDSGTFPVGQMFSGEREKQDGYNTFGNVNASSLGNEIVSDNSMSITLRADTIYNAFNPEVLPQTVNRNTLMAMLEGSGIDEDGTYVELMSTTGVRLTCPLDVTDAQYLFNRDGYFVIDGKKKVDANGNPDTKKNPYVDKYNKTSICTTMELGIAPTAETSDDVVFRFPFVASENVQFAEGTDQNNYTADCKFLADRGHTLQLMYDGFSDNETDTVAITGATSIYKVNATVIAYTSTATAPLILGTAGDIAVIIDTDDDTVAIYKFDTTWTNAPVTSTLGEGFVAWSDQVVNTALTGTVTTAGSTALVGAGTAFESELEAGDIITVAGEVLEIASVTTDTAAVLVTAAATSVAGLSVLTSTSSEVAFMTVKTAGLTEVAVAGTYGSTFYVIPAVDAITNDVNRTTFWTNYTTA